MEPSRLEIVYEDEVLVAVNKPAHMPVHGRPGGRRPDLLGVAEQQLGRRLVLFHRLDIDTTGVVLLGKDRSINPAMAAVFAEKRIRKMYWTVVRGVWRAEWNRVETRIDRAEPKGFRNVVAGGKIALTTFRRLAVHADKSWLEALPKTGRTHQIRLHCLALGCPILGDALYGERTAMPIALHARRIDLRHPQSGEVLRLIAEPPDYWTTHWLNELSPEPQAMPQPKPQTQA